MKSLTLTATLIVFVLNTYSPKVFAENAKDFIESVKQEKLNEERTTELAMGFYDAHNNTLTGNEVIALAKLIRGYDGNTLLKIHAKKKDLSSSEITLLAEELDKTYVNGKATLLYEMAIRKRFLEEMKRPDTSSFIKEMKKIEKEDSTIELRVRLASDYYDKHREYLKRNPGEVIKIARDLNGYAKNGLLSRYLQHSSSDLTPAQIANISSEFDRDKVNDRSEPTLALAHRRKFIDNAKSANVSGFIEALNQIKDSDIKEALVFDFYEKHKTDLSTQDIIKLANILDGYEKNQLLNKFISYSAETISPKELESLASKYDRKKINDSTERASALKIAKQFSVSEEALNNCIRSFKNCAN